MGMGVGIRQDRLSTEQRDMLVGLIGRRWPWPCSVRANNRQWAVMQQLQLLGLVQRLAVECHSKKSGSWMLSGRGGEMAQRITRSRRLAVERRERSAWLLHYERRSGGLRVMYRPGATTGRWPAAEPLTPARRRKP